MSRSSPPSRHFQTSLSSERIDRNWQAIASRVPTVRRRRRIAPIAASLVGFAAMCLLLFRYPLSGRGAIDGATLQTGAGEEQLLELSDGTRIQLLESTKLRLLRVSGRDIRMELEKGAIDLHVTHVDGRQFTVAAKDVEVGVIGTRFHVGIDPDDNEVQISVAEGKVQLRSASKGKKEEPRYLVAGEKWSVRQETYSPGPPVLVPSSLPSAVAPQAPSWAPRPNRFKLSRQFSQFFKQGRYVEALAELGDFHEALKTLPPGDLFSVAQAARFAGRVKDAAVAFDALRSRFPEDNHAVLAALELGRIRLSELDDPSGALEAFEDVVKLEPSGLFREDADARIVQALEAAGQREPCMEARDRYLKTYPHGAHALTVARRCPTE